MRRASGVLAVLAGAALVATTSGAAIGQEESPSPDVSMVPETSMAPDASMEATVVEPSTLDIIEVAGDKSANKPLRGKKLSKAIAKAAPAAASYVIDSTGDDVIGQIIGLSLAARAADEAGDAKLGEALIDITQLLYRNEWTRTKSDPASLNAAIEAAVSAAGMTGNPALLQIAIWDRWMDVCSDPGGAWLGVNQDDPASCADEGGTPVRADFTGITPDASTTPDELDLVDAGGLGIHKITQDKTANDKLAGKKYKKAWAKALKKHGPTIASMSAYGPDANPEQQVIELVLAAREADEAGDAKAARAYMALALTTYRSIVPKPADGTINTEALNNSLAELISSGYANAPGLAMRTPPDMVSVCYQPKGSKCFQSAGDHTPWECAQGGTVFTRMTREEALAANCPEVE